MTSFLPLCLLALVLDASANPLPVPTPPPLGTTSASGESPFATPTCTTTLTKLVAGFQGEWTPSILKTVYTTTETVYSRVPCGGCALAITADFAGAFGGLGPVEMVTGTTTATEPFSTTLTVCSADPSSPPHQQIPRDGLDVRQDEPSTAAECTHTQFVPITPLLMSEHTRTIYTATDTITSHIDCSGCNLVHVSTVDYLNPGPVIHFTTTLTAESPSAATTYACLQTRSFITPPTTRTLPVEPTASAADAPLRRRDDQPQPTTTTTITKTLTRTAYSATVTAVVTATDCGPVSAADGPPGAIPRRQRRQEGDDGIATVYATVVAVVDGEGMWTRTSFHCADTTDVSFTHPHPHPPPPPPTPTAGRGMFGGLVPGPVMLVPAAAGTEAATRPPSRPPPPANPTTVTSTVNLGGRS
ncbi:hypothetical protein QBC33DRAFT_589683 [Phialemonium atrogriseum]|uniref:Uncharacterized protein n=1 Tax=Phialemonium atrogriseum TaxID=1093897 RepID=A0AAJ0BX14_9PEZI|nr:uncharacterized protein QBC33DRAFT_589683 [Phialemonium atrogriseum]KAK1765865.1 hypothetical protein QBC33DRAFT_589683 [Phialemonium atrogriseum]